MGEPKRTEQADYNARHSEEIDKESKAFKKRIKALRKSNGYTQEEAAKKLDISKHTIQGYEQKNKNRQDAPFFIKQLANLYGVSADYLVGLSETPHPEYEPLKEKLGLNDYAIQQLIELHLLDGDEDEYHGNLDFINCFLGNEECTGLFMQSLTPLLKDVYVAPSISDREEAIHQLNRHITEYVKKVVVPTYLELYESRTYTPTSPEEYRTTHPTD